MSGCREWNKRLLKFALGDASEMEAREVEGHAAGCAACGARLKEIRARVAKIDAALPKFVLAAEPAPGFDARLFARIESLPSARSRFIWRIGLAATGVACAIAIAAVVGPMLRSYWIGGAEQPPPATVSISEWRSPTEGLLRSSGSDLLQSGPGLGDFYFQLDSSSRVKTNREGRKGK